MEKLKGIFLGLLFVLVCTSTAWSQISLSPNSGDAGTSFSVTITGAAFAGSSTMQCVEVSDGTTTFSFNASSPASPTMSITGTMNIPANARPGSGYNVTVYSNNSCSGGVDGSCTDCFTVNSPNNISASPDSGEQDSSFGVTITAVGFQFVGTPTTQCVEIYNNTTSYTFNGSSAASPTGTLSGTLNLPLNAPPGLYNAVVYDNLGGICSGSYTGSCVECFTVNAIPQVTSLSPNSGDRGDSFGVTITGLATSWSGTHCVEISNATTTLTFPATANSNTELVGTIDIPLDASVGNDYDVVVYADDSGVCAGGTDGDCTNCFAVTEPAPMGDIMPNPNQGNAGETFGVTLTGIGTSWASLTSHCVEIFDDAENTIIQFTTDVASTDFNFMSGSLSIPFATPAGFYNMRVYDRNDGVCSDALDGSCTDCFQILPPLPPSVTAISPNSGDRGDSFGVTITGNNTSWSGTHCVVISNASTTLTFTGTANSNTELVGTLDIPLDAFAASDYDITVYADPTGDCNGDTDGTCTDCFAVTTPTPMGNIIPNPDTELAGETFGVSLTGLGTSWASLTSHCVEIYDNSETTIIQFTMNVASADFNFMTGTVSLPFATPAGFYNIRVYDRNDGVCEGSLDGNCTDCFEVLEAICPTPVLNLSPESFCANDDVVMGLGGGSPVGGVYSGPGVTDDGNGETYSFDAAAAGAGIHIITYSLTLSDDCMVSASGEVVVLPLATATFTALDDLCVDAGAQNGLGGGEPIGGVYSGPGVTDDGNGETYSFDPAAAGVGVHDISYTYDPSLEAQGPILGFGSSFIGEMMGDRFGQSSDISQDGTTLAVRTSAGDDTSGGTAIGLVGTFRITDFCPDPITVVDQVEVFDRPEVNLTTVAGYCLDAPIANASLTGGSPSGGVYSGPGVTDLGNGTQYNFDPMAVGTGVITITYTFTDANGCVNSATSDIEVFDCAFEVTDPCACLDNATIIDLDAGTGGDDGQFSEVVSVSNATGGMLPANQIWTVTAASGALDAYNIPAIGVQSAGVPVATDGSVTLTFNAGIYELPFVHVDAQDYSIMVEGPFGQGSAANVTLTISNICQYPNPIFDPVLPDFICGTEPAITLDGIDTNGGTDDAITFTINGTPATEFDPVALGIGFYTVVMTYDGADDGNGGFSPDGTTPASPGCTQTVQKVVEVGGLPPILTCPTNDFGLPAGCNPTVPAAATTFNLLGDPNPDPALPTVEDGCGILTLISSDAISDD
ncbi:MAG: hypothetical protein AAFO03_20540, partial [Bacteroidota bacterium]